VTTGTATILRFTKASARGDSATTGSAIAHLDLVAFARADAITDGAANLVRLVDVSATGDAVSGFFSIRHRLAPLTRTAWVPGELRTLRVPDEARRIAVGTEDRRLRA
jgi:hypothetical protein